MMEILAWSLKLNRMAWRYSSAAVRGASRRASLEVEGQCRRIRIPCRAPMHRFISHILDVKTRRLNCRKSCRAGMMVIQQQ
jgi:hypothetical protein